VQQRSENPPTCIQLIVADKIRVVTLQSIEDKCLVCLWDFEITETASISEIKLSDRSLHTESRQLRVHLNIDTLVGLDANNKLIAGDVFEDTAGDVLELDSYFGLLLVQSYLEGYISGGSEITHSREF